MSKNIFFHIFLLFALECDAQITSEKDKWSQQFGDTTISTQVNKTGLVNPIFNDASKNYLLVRLRNPDFSKFFRHRDLQILRWLDRHTFICSKDAPVNDLLLSGVIKYAIPANNLWKLSPALLTKYQKQYYDRQSKIFFVRYTSKAPFLASLRHMDSGYKIIKAYPDFMLIVLDMDEERAIEHLPNNRFVLNLDYGHRKLAEEQLISKIDISANALNLFNAFYPWLQGEDVHISIKETRFDTTDIDFKNRTVHSGIESDRMSGHAAIMATIAAGSGNTSPRSRGLAWASDVSSSDFTTLLPDNPSIYQNLNISVQNHSYGVEGIENFYGLDAMAYDQSVNDNPSLVHVFSAGNQGSLASDNGLYIGIEDFANLSGSFKMAKNILVVGAMDKFGRTSDQSSRGPAYDGRIKPEIVAIGESGSSSSAAVVTGTVALLQQFYKLMHGDTLPPASLIKSILISSADDTGNRGPDFVSGFGKLDGDGALKILEDHQYDISEITDNDFFETQIEVDDNTAEVVVSLVWNDPEGLPFSDLALVNDLDLEIIAPDGSTYLPWVLNSHPHSDSLKSNARRKKDHLNNVELVSIGDPEPGIYTIRVHGFLLQTVKQFFSLSYAFEQKNQFHWIYPVVNDHLLAGFSDIIRWKTNLIADSAILEYSVDDGHTWAVISDSLDLSTGLLEWSVPVTTAGALLRIRADSNFLFSDRFTIHDPLNLLVGFNCEDSVLMHWQSVTGTEAYTIYNLDHKYMDIAAVTTDTLILLSKKDFPSAHFAVGPVMEGIGQVNRGVTKNIENQGAGCYIDQFSTLLLDGRALLNAEIGTLFRVKNLRFEKMINNRFESIRDIQPVIGQNFVHVDSLLYAGVNRYRLRVGLQDGSFIYSPIREIYYTRDLPYIVFPNPLSSNSNLNVISRDVSVPDFYLYDSIGRFIFSFQLDDFLSIIRIPGLSSGIYYYLISGDDAVPQSGVIQVFD